MFLLDLAKAINNFQKDFISNFSYYGGKVGLDISKYNTQVDNSSKYVN